MSTQREEYSGVKEAHVMAPTFKSKKEKCSGCGLFAESKLSFFFHKEKYFKVVLPILGPMLELQYYGSV